MATKFKGHKSTRLARPGQAAERPPKFPEHEIRRRIGDGTADQAAKRPPKFRPPTKEGLLALRRYEAIAHELEDLSLGRQVRNDDNEALLAAFCAGTELLDLSEKLESVLDPPKSAALYAAFVLRGTVQALLSDGGQAALQEGFLGAAMGLCSESLFACGNSAEHLCRMFGLWELPEPPAPPKPELPKRAALPTAPPNAASGRPMLMTPTAKKNYAALQAAVRKAIPPYDKNDLVLLTGIFECLDVAVVAAHLAAKLDCPAMHEDAAASPKGREAKAHAK